MEGGHTFPRLESKGVVMTANAFVESVEGEGAEIYSLWGGWRRTFEANTVVLSLLRRPVDELYRELEQVFTEVHLIGDALAPRRTMVAMYEGERTGRLV